MSKYTCNGFRPANATSIGEAAEIFANRAARRKYGKSAYCRTCTQQSFAADGSLAEYSAFIGYTTAYDDRLRRCPSFSAWHRSTQAFIAHNNADKTISSRLRLAMDHWSTIISDEFNRRAYQAGPVGVLP